MRLIKEVRPSSGTSAVAFGAFAPTWGTLQLRIDARGKDAGTGVNLLMTINGDGATNYEYEFVGARGVSATAGNTAALSALNAALIAVLPASGAPVKTPGSVLVDMPFYNGRVNKKNLHSRASYRIANTSGGMYTYEIQGWWNSTAPITSLNLFTATGTFASGSWLGLYGYADNG